MQGICFNYENFCEKFCFNDDDDINDIFLSIRTSNVAKEMFS